MVITCTKLYTFCSVQDYSVRFLLQQKTGPSSTELDVHRVTRSSAELDVLWLGHRLSSMSRDSVIDWARCHVNRSSTELDGSRFMQLFTYLDAVFLSRFSINCMLLNLRVCRSISACKWICDVGVRSRDDVIALIPVNIVQRLNRLQMSEKGSMSVLESTSFFAQ